MTPAVAAVAAADLVAWTVEVDDPGELLTWLPAGQAFGFLRGGDGIVELVERSCAAQSNGVEKARISSELFLRLSS